jgi:hypothetical protein
MRLAGPLVPAGEVIRGICDATTQKQAGPHIAGRARDRHGAGSARQAERTLRGVTCVWGVRRVPRTRWPGHSFSGPGGLALYLKPAQAHQLTVP